MKLLKLVLTDRHCYDKLAVSYQYVMASETIKYEIEFSQGENIWLKSGRDSNKDS